MHKAVPLSLIDPNPFRAMDRYPINQDKIAALMASMNRTGYWGNVVARKAGDRYQLAYGHHRWIAFKKKFGKDATMQPIVSDLTDEEMIRVMAKGITPT
jgi:ParB-like chromosome segregation protein Spo0J